MNDIEAVSHTDVWAVGECFGGHDTPQVEHWDGSTWSIVDSPAPSYNMELYAVDGRSSSNAWAVGANQEEDEGPNPVVEHWDGSAWAVFDQ